MIDVRRRWPTASASESLSGFGRLLAEPGVVERLELRSPFGFMAFHGGALERQTDRIASAAADAAGASLYVVAHPAPDPPHFPSTDGPPRPVAGAQAFLDHVHVVVTVHGFGRDGMFTTLLLGGSQPRRSPPRSRAELGAALPDYEIVDDLEAIPRELRGLHPDNPVNLPAARRRPARAATARARARPALGRLGGRRVRAAGRGARRRAGPGRASLEPVTAPSPRRRVAARRRARRLAAARRRR